MIRIVIENILLFLMPTLVYLIFVLVTRPDSRNGTAVLDDAPLIWLFVAGASLLLVTLVFFSSTSGGKPGQSYTPPSIKDGRITPGHID